MNMTVNELINLGGISLEEFKKAISAQESINSAKLASVIELAVDNAVLHDEKGRAYCNGFIARTILNLRLTQVLTNIEFESENVLDDYDRLMDHIHNVIYDEIPLHDEFMYDLVPDRYRYDNVLRDFKERLDSKIASENSIEASVDKYLGKIADTLIDAISSLESTLSPESIGGMLDGLKEALRVAGTNASENLK